MKKILVDTSVIIELLRMQNKEESLYFKVFSNKENAPVIASVTIAELFAGKSSGNNKTKKILMELLNSVEIYYSTFETLVAVGELVRDMNYKISLQDAEIAVVSRVNKFPLLTLNTKDFSSISGVILL